MRIALCEARGHGLAVKVAAQLREEDGVQERAALKAQVSGLFRVLYGEWAETFTEDVRVTETF